MKAEIKYAQWEKLRQLSYPKSDLFFQQFESLAFKASIIGNKKMMMAQVKKAIRETTKNTIYAANREVPTTYQE